MGIKVERWPAFVITGLKSTFPIGESFAQIPKIWQMAEMDGTMNRLYELWAKSDLRPSGILGISSRSLTEEGVMDYFLAVTTYVDLPGAEVTEFPEDLQSFKFPSVGWAVVEAEGALPTAISRAYQEFTSEWLPRSDYTSAPLPIVECYIQDNSQQVWFPVVAKKWGSHGQG